MSWNPINIDKSYYGLHFGTKKAGKISAVLEDLSRIK